MAISTTTTIKPTTLSVSINEQVSVNGVQYGNNTIKGVDNCGKVDQRVMATYSDVYTPFFGWVTRDGKGIGTQSEFAYLRITNTDSLLGVTISFKDGTGTSRFLYLLPGTSYVLFSPDSAIGGDEEVPSVLRKITEVSAKCDKPAVPVKDEVYQVYIEYLAVFKGGYDANDTSNATSQ
jgi:hypothetical protein